MSAIKMQRIMTAAISFRDKDRSYSSQEKRQENGWDSLLQIFETTLSDWMLEPIQLANLAIAAYAASDYDVQDVDLSERALIYLTRGWLGEEFQTRRDAQAILERIDRCICSRAADHEPISEALLRIRNDLNTTLYLNPGIDRAVATEEARRVAS